MFFIKKTRYYVKLMKEMQEIICDAVNVFPDFTEILFPLTFYRQTKKYLSERLN